MIGGVVAEKLRREFLMLTVDERIKAAVAEVEAMLEATEAMLDLAEGFALAAYELLEEYDLEAGLDNEARDWFQAKRFFEPRASRS